MDVIFPSRTRMERRAEAERDTDYFIESPTRPAVTLVGFMGAGKSTVGEILAIKLGRECAETDAFVEALAGEDIRTIFETKGEAFFRELETRALGELLTRDGIVISCGGGVPLSYENAELLRLHGNCVYLKASPETILERVKDSSARPLLDGRLTAERIAALMAERAECYESVADITVDTDDKTVGAICDEIIAALEL